MKATMERDMTTANDIASSIAFQSKRHLKNQRRAWLYFARAVLIFGWLWAVAVLVWSVMNG